MDAWVVAYDIANERRRDRVARILDDYGTRVQESVFELWLEPADWPVLEKQLSQVLNPQEDRLRCYPLCKGCRGKIRDLGLASPPAFVIEEVIFA